jgi:DNA-binding NtrC family response regulator
MTKTQLMPAEPEQYRAFSVLIVDDEADMRLILHKALKHRFARVDCAGSIEEAETLRQHQHYDLIILDINLPGRSGIEWNEIFDGKENTVDVIFITGYATIETTISALKLGACDFILKPFNLEQIITSIEQCIQKRLEKRKRKALSREVNQHIQHVIIGNSDKTKLVRQLTTQYALSKATVLIEGEPGTGKQLIARTLHKKSHRCGPFVALNCSMISEANLEKELFGDGQREEGLIRLAHNGTLFIDEIGDMPWELQGALLRVLERRSLRANGSNVDIHIDVRFIVATSHNLQDAIKNSTFRHDLYYRLAVLKIDAPPLRQRKADLIELIPYFTRQLCHELSLSIPSWVDQYSGEMHHYDWPGNVRELRNLIERCLLLNKSPSSYWSDINVTGKHHSGLVVSVSHLNHLPNLAIDPNESEQLGYPDNWTLKDVEKAHILKVIKYHEGNKSGASRELGISRKTLERKFKEWDVDDKNKDIDQ